MKIELYSPLYIHEIGQRENQEDAIYPSGEKASKENRLFILCDGMGGHECGEVASQTVCSSLGKWFEDHVDPRGSFQDEQLKQSIEYAYSELDKFDSDHLKKMGTTLTLLYIHNKGITAAHMGDSRIYHIRPDKGVLYQSRDHSLVFDLFQSGEITYEEMLNYPQKNIVTRAMTPGEDNRMRPDIIHITDIQPNDYFYMCSDGMLETMSNQELISIISDDKTDMEKRNKLIERTKDHQDNHSAWLIHIKDVVKEDGDEALPNEEPTSRCNVAFSMPDLANEENDVVIVRREKKSIFQRMIYFFYNLFHLKKALLIMAFALTPSFLMAQAAGGAIKRPLSKTTKGSTNVLIPKLSKSINKEKREVLLKLIDNMVYVEGGTFIMGATSEQGADVSDDEKPAHRVTLSSFYIGKYEVTQEEWETVMENNPSKFKGKKRPVECVSWDDCRLFIKELNVMTGMKFRLPTEAEWEFAARGGIYSKGYKYAGSNSIDKVAWYGDNCNEKNQIVGTKAPNELGLYDMSGNVYEYCQDVYQKDFYSISPQNNPKGPSIGYGIVMRGGCVGFHGYPMKLFRVSNRMSTNPDIRIACQGLRLACNK